MKQIDFIRTYFFATCLLFSTGLFALEDFPSAALLDDQSYEGRIRLASFLDEPDGYCVDIPGGPGNPIPIFNGLWAHTCHMFTEIDQVFAINSRGLNQITWGNHPDESLRCVTALDDQAGGAVGISLCDESSNQKFSYNSDGQFQLVESELCIFVQATGPAPRQELVDGQDSRGRGLPINPQASHLARALVLQPCISGDDRFSRWIAH